MAGVQQASRSCPAELLHKLVLPCWLFYYWYINVLLYPAGYCLGLLYYLGLGPCWNDLLTFSSLQVVKITLNPAKLSLSWLGTLWGFGKQL